MSAPFDILLMCAAGIITDVQAMYGTSLYTQRTARAKRVVYRGKIINNLDCAVRTGLFALHTSDTAVFALLSRDSAFFVVGAFNNNLRGV